MTHEQLIAEVARLLAAPERDVALDPIHTGGNNRVFLVRFGERRLVAKWYFRHPSDNRDRLGAEYAFLTCAQQAGIACVPRPVACAGGMGLGLYDYIEGRKLAAEEIDAACIDQAAEFFLRLNRPSVHALGRDLPNASEACFSTSEHFVMVDGRIGRLGGIAGDEEVDREAREFSAALADRWQQVKSAILKEARQARIDPDAPLAERCISPSDFGFHNALSTPARGIFFIDFEYAGWDDPAKLVGDFFSHPAVPIGMAHFERFLDSTMHYAPRTDRLAVRARLLFPVFQVKWCCIILNDFLPDSAQRRRFAGPNRDVAVHKREQLAKALSLFERIQF